MDVCSFTLVLFPCKDKFSKIQNAVERTRADQLEAEIDGLFNGGIRHLEPLAVVPDPIAEHEQRLRPKTMDILIGDKFSLLDLAGLIAFFDQIADIAIKSGAKSLQFVEMCARNQIPFALQQYIAAISPQLLYPEKIKGQQLFPDAIAPVGLVGLQLFQRLFEDRPPDILLDGIKGGI